MFFNPLSECTPGKLNLDCFVSKLPATTTKLQSYGENLGQYVYIITQHMSAHMTKTLTLTTALMGEVWAEL